MASLDLATLSVRIEADSTGAVTGINQVGQASQQQSQKVQTDWNKVGKDLTSIGKKLSLAVSLPIIAAGTACVKLASDLTETLGKTEVVFGDMSDSVISWSETSIDSMGLSQQTALDMASTYGDLGTSMGLTTGEAMNMSTNLVQLAADMASFKNISIERANSALTAIYTGETESLKALGVVMTEANLETFAMNEGIGKTYKEMSQTEKVMLRYKYVMQQTSNAQGDFKRTGDSLANQSRKLGENVKQLGASFGQILEPAITAIISTINDVVSWINSLDDGTKRVITTIAEITAIIPIVVLAVGTVITAVKALQVQLTALMANPIVLVITAVIAALAALAIIIGNVSAAIAEYNKKVAEMEDKYVTVQTTYEELITVLEDENNTIDDVIADTKAAIKAAESAGDFLASVATVEDKDRDVKKVLSAIDSALKAREHWCEISGKKKEDDAIWQELNEYKNGIAEGTITIYGEDGDATLSALGTTIGNIKDNLVALEVYETDVIKPIIEVESADAQANAKALYDKCAEIAGLDTDIDYVFSVTNLGSTEGGDGVLGQLAMAIASVENWAGKLDELKSSFEAMIEQQKEFLLTISASQVASAFQAYNSGLITMEELEATCRAANSQYQDLSASLDASSGAYDNLIASLNNGNPDDDMQAWADFLNVTLELNPQMAETASASEQVAAASGRISDAMSKGATDADAMRGDVELLNSGLTSLGDDMEGQVTSAYDTYNQAIADTNATEVEGIAAVDEAIAKKKEEQDALATFATFMSENNNNQAAALEALRGFSEEQYQTVIDFYGGVPEEMGILNSQIYDDAYTLQFDILAMEESAESDKQAVRDTAAAARLAAEQTLGDTLASITSRYDLAELTQLRQQQATIGNEEGISQLERIAGLTAYCTTARGLVEQNCFDTVSLNETCINQVDGLSYDGTDAGRNVGNAMGEGMYNGMSDWAGKIANKAAQMVKDAIAAARKEADVNSPSKKMRDLVGKPIGEGLEVGIDSQMDSVLKTVKADIGKVFTVGTQAIPRTNANTGVTNNVSKQGNTNITQNNNFTSRTLSPFEQQQQIHRLNKDLSGVFA